MIVVVAVMAEELNLDCGATTAKRSRAAFEQHEIAAAYNKVSWGAIFAGVAAALAAQFLLNLLGVGFGAAALKVDQQQSRRRRSCGTFRALRGLLNILTSKFELEIPCPPKRP